MLQASELSYGYSSGRRDARSFTLDQVSVSVERGSLTGLLGPNGCGKTTLLKLLSGVLQPEHGHVSLNGNSLAGRSRRDIARHLAVVPQETHPAFDYTVMEMVLMGRHPHLGAFELEGPRDLAGRDDGNRHSASRHARVHDAERRREAARCDCQRSHAVARRAAA
jgi:ABC-type cobalamin/Fe3+-siderophores transport system ATPase subunit